MHDRCSKEVQACHLDIIHYKGVALGWPPPKSLTLNAEQHVSRDILLDGHIEGRRGLYILKITAWGIQGVLAQTSHPARPVHKGEDLGPFIHDTSVEVI